MWEKSQDGEHDQNTLCEIHKELKYSFTFKKENYHLTTRIKKKESPAQLDDTAPRTDELLNRNFHAKCRMLPQ